MNQADCTFPRGVSDRQRDVPVRVTISTETRHLFGGTWTGVAAQSRQGLLKDRQMFKQPPRRVRTSDLQSRMPMHAGCHSTAVVLPALSLRLPHAVRRAKDADRDCKTAKDHYSSPEPSRTPSPSRDPSNLPFLCSEKVRNQDRCDSVCADVKGDGLKYLGALTLLLD